MWGVDHGRSQAEGPGDRPKGLAPEPLGQRDRELHSAVEGKEGPVPRVVQGTAELIPRLHRSPQAACARERVRGAGPGAGAGIRGRSPLPVPLSWPPHMSTPVEVTPREKKCLKGARAFGGQLGASHPTYMQQAGLSSLEQGGRAGSQGRGLSSGLGQAWRCVRVGGMVRLPASE